MAASVVAARELRIAVGDGSISALWRRPRGAVAALALAHGSGAGMRHPFMAALAAALVGEGIATLRYQFAYREARRPFPDRPPVLIATARAAVAEATRLAGGLPLFAGGKSLGGRMSSQAAAGQPLAGVCGLVFFGFPLHPAKRPGVERAAHLAQIQLPMLFLQGTRDALAKLELLTPICRELPTATLHLVEGADHSFGVLKRSGRSAPEVLAELARTTRGWLEAI